MTSNQAKIPRSQSAYVNESQSKRVRTAQEQESEIVEEDRTTSHHNEQPCPHNLDSSTDVSDCEDYESDHEKDNKKLKSKCWNHFFKRKLKAGQPAVSKNGKKKPNKIVVCQVQTEKGICNKTLPHNDNSTSKMVRHLNSRHKISFAKSEVKEKDTVYCLLMFIITASLPYRCVENRFFKMFCECLDPNFKIPSRKQLSDLTSKHYLEKKGLVVKKLNEAKSVNYTTDSWTSIQNYSYLSLTVHFLDKHLKLSAIVLAVRHIIGGHTAKNMVDYLTEIINEYGLSMKGKFITTDNVNNMIKMASDLNLERIPCIAHILHLIVKNSLLAIKENSKTNSNIESDEESEYVTDSHPKYNDENGKESDAEALKNSAKTTFQTYSRIFKLFNSGILSKYFE